MMKMEMGIVTVTVMAMAERVTTTITTNSLNLSLKRVENTHIINQKFIKSWIHCHTIPSLFKGEK